MEKFELNERYYREVTVNGEILGKWVYLYKITKYDSKGNIIYDVHQTFIGRILNIKCLYLLLNVFE